MQATMQERRGVPCYGRTCHYSSRERGTRARPCPYPPIRVVSLRDRQRDLGWASGDWTGGTGSCQACWDSGEATGERSCRLGIMGCHHARSYSSDARFDTCTLANRLAWRTRFDEPKCFSATLKRVRAAVLCSFEFSVFLGREL